MERRKVVLITGSATALAREIAFALAKDYRIIIHYNSNQKKALEIQSELGLDNCKIIQADFTKVDVNDFFSSALNLFNQIDIIINAASIFNKIKTEDITREILEKYNDIHSVFPLLLSIEFYKYLKLNNKLGCVVNISDAQLDRPTDSRIPYYLAKNALSFQTKLLSNSLAPIVRVNEIAPGFTLAKEYEEKYFKKIEDVLPFGITKSKEIIDAINYFINSEQVSGQTLKVDSGLSVLPTKLI